MKKFIPVILVALCLCIIAASACLTVFKIAKGSVTLSIKDITGNPGDTVVIPVSISDNKGITNIAFSLEYDKSVLTYSDYYTAKLGGCDVYDHSDEGRITFASIDNADLKDNGDIAFFTFKIDDNAEYGETSVNLNGIYCDNGDDDPINIKANTCKLEIAPSCTAGHIYTESGTLVEPDCTNSGLSLQVCGDCGHTTLAEIEPSGHTLRSEFVVDVEATDKEPGMISRHCTVCGTKTDIIVYNNENVSALDINAVAGSLSDDSISNLVYFLNGEKTYPDIPGNSKNVNGLISKDLPAVNRDGSVNVNIAVDDILCRFFGKDKKGGLYGSLKRAAIADEIPLKAFVRLLSAFNF